MILVGSKFKKKIRREINKRKNQLFFNKDMEMKKLDNQFKILSQLIFFLTYSSVLSNTVNFKQR